MPRLNSKVPPRCGGFTMAELLMTILTGALLALVAGSMLVFFYMGWRQDHEAVDLQRDGTIAVEFLARSLRAASPDKVSVASQQIDIAGASANERFYVNGNNLLYDADSGSAGGAVVLVRDHLVAFTPVKELRSVSYRMVIDNGNDRSDIQGTFKQRN